KGEGAGGEPQPVQGDPLKTEPYLTIRPALRDMLLRVETKGDGEKLLFSSATHLKAAKLTSPNPDEAGRITFRTRPIWDVVNLLDEKTDRLDYGGMAMVTKDATAYTFRNALTCGTDAETRQLHRDLTEGAAPEVIQFFKRVLSHKVELIKEELKIQPTDPTQPGFGEGGVVRPGFGEGGQPKPEPKEEVKTSRIKVTLGDKTVDFTLDLVLTGQALDAMRGTLELMVLGLKGDADIASGEDY